MRVQYERPAIFCSSSTCKSADTFFVRYLFVRLMKAIAKLSASSLTSPKQLTPCLVQQGNRDLTDFASHASYALRIERFT